MGFKPARQRYIASQKPNSLPTELSGRLILLYKGLKGKARIPTDDPIPKTRRCRNSHSKALQLPSASIEVYKCSFSPPDYQGLE